MKRPRKRNWYAGLTLEQRAIATQIQRDRIRAFNDELARGALSEKRPHLPPGADIARALPHGFKLTPQ
jgi:hypothetical protein